MSLRNYSNTAPPTQLSAAVSASATSLPVVSSNGYPTPPFVLALERGTAQEETCLCTSIPDSTHFTVTRGFDGMTPVAHNPPAAVEHSSTSADLREPNSFINLMTGEGDLISYHAGAPVRVAGAAPSGYVLTSQGAAFAPAYQGLPGKTLVLPHTFSIMGNPAVSAAGTTTFVPGFFVPIPGTTVSATLVGVDARIDSGTSATVSIYRNGAAMASPFSGMSVTTTLLPVTGSVALANNDFLTPFVTAITGSPEGLTVTLLIAWAF